MREAVSTARRYREFAQLHAWLLKRVKGCTPAADSMPAMPSTRRVGNKLDPNYLDLKRKALQEYLQALAAIAQPDIPPDDDEHAGAVEAIRTWLGRFLRGEAVGEAAAGDAEED